MKAVIRTKPVSAVRNIDVEEEIRQRAYQLFEARGGEEGRELEDWLQAEEEIRRGKTHAAAA